MGSVMAEPIVDTSAGKIRGITDSTGIHSFKGIPYGASTTEPHRFLPPAPPIPWQGVRDAFSYGPSCVQPRDADNVESQTMSDLWGPNGIKEQSDDCLVLNVWTRGLHDGGKRPVMVWLHGGAFVLGAGNEFGFYDGASLARRGDVVVVSVNHRLGILGYLYLAELDPVRCATSGNAGMLDLIAALRWVRDNIERFGGDPGCVTIFGESGGGEKVSTLLAMPDAQGLFHRAVIQSGPGLRGVLSERASEVTREELALLHLDASRLDELQSVAVARLIEVQVELAKRDRIGVPGAFAPVVDGEVLPVHPFDPVPAPTGAKVPIMIGTNQHEMSILLFLTDPAFGKYDESKLRKRLETALTGELAIAPDRIEGLLAAYREAMPDASTTDLLVAITTDAMMRVPSIRLAERKAASGAAPVYMYLFARKSPAIDGRLGSPHVLEIPFVFDNVSEPVGLVGDDPRRFALAATMSDAWIAFARSGDPNHAGLPKWPSYASADRATMIFDDECRLENDPLAFGRRALEHLI
jgi:para-nitrobenzyl esterase